MGEGAKAISTAYDWLHDYLDEKDREIVRACLKALCSWIEEFSRSYPDEYWFKNMYQAPYAGPGVAALALLGEEPAAERWLELAKGKIKLFLERADKRYPDGGWCEGAVHTGLTRSATRCSFLMR